MRVAVFVVAMSSSFLAMLKSKSPRPGKGSKRDEGLSEGRCFCGGYEKQILSDVEV